MSQLDDFVAYLEYIATQTGVYYWQGGGRCNPEQSGYTDCSGFVVAGLHHVGVEIICTGSFQLSRWCHQARTGISIDAARNTRGALLFIGANEGQGRLDGSADGVWPGHVATSRGDGTIVEARNRRAGVLISPFGWARWDYAAMPPWLSHQPTPATPAPPTPAPVPPPPPPPPPRKETTLFISPNFGSDKFHPHAAAVIGDLLRVFDTKTNPFHEGEYKEFGPHVRYVDLGLVKGEVPLFLGDKDERGRTLAPDHLICWTLMGDGTTLSRHDLHWIV